MTSKRKGCSYPSVKFLRASSTLQTFTTLRNVGSETGKSEVSGYFTGEEAREFYETLLKEPEKETRGQPGSGNEQLKHEKPDNISLKTKRNTSSSSSKRIKRDSTDISSFDLRKINLFLGMAQNGNLERLREVIQDGEIDINAMDQFGWTALMCAAHSCHKTCVKYLLKHGARPDLCNNQGQTAEDIAECAGASHLRDVFKKYLREKRRESQLTQATVVEESWCEICKSRFSGTKQKHDSSTVHLFHCQHKSERTLYHIPEDNIGFQLMKKKGWDKDKGLGPEGTGCKFPVKTIFKQDRLGLGSKRKDKARITHFPANDPAAVDTQGHAHGNRRVTRKTSKRKWIQDQMKERKWEHDMRVYMNTE